MPYQPIVPASGYLGWRLFERLAPRQLELFRDDATIARNIDYFNDKITSAKSAKDLVDDRRLLTVALGAYGLQDEIDKKAFIQKVLEEGTDEPTSLANRLNDPRWKEFAEGFGYGNIAGPRILLSAFRESVGQRYIERGFEQSVGNVDTDIRLALNFKREISKIAASENVDRIGWFQVLGQRPVRAVFESALGLPDSIGSLDIDKQKSAFEDRFRNIFGAESLSSLNDPEFVEALLRRFFLQSSLTNGPAASTRGSAALNILTGPSASAPNLVLSRL